MRPRHKQDRAHPLLWAAALATAALFLAARPIAAAADTPNVQQNGRIVYSVGAILPDPDPAAASQVYTVYPDGTGRRQLTHVRASVQAGDPSYSPDGSRIAYVSNATGRFQIWVMRGDGSDQRRLVVDPGHDAFVPRWAPDARHLLYTRCTAPFGFTECTIATVGTDGTSVHDVTGGHWVDFDARYSPDGQTIAFSSNREGLLSSVWRMAPDGSGLRRLTDPDLEAFWPDYAPDGRHILFTSNLGRPISQVYRMRPDGQSVTRLTHFTDRSGDFASYSPDGQRVVLDYAGSLAVMNADGSGIATIATPNDLVLADWGPR